MMVLITYDVSSFGDGQKRLRRVAKECQNYGIRVQNSVFECVLDAAQARMLKQRIEDIIDLKEDSVRFYFMGSNWDKHIEILGKTKGYNATSMLIL